MCQVNMWGKVESLVRAVIVDAETGHGIGARFTIEFEGGIFCLYSAQR